MITKYSYIIIGIAVLLAGRLEAQNIQWASQVDSSYNFIIQDSNWNIETILGSPDAKMGQLDEDATKLLSDAEYGSVTIEFAESISKGNIVIIENYLPGRISEVSVIDSTGTEHSKYKNSPKILLEDHRILIIPFDEYKPINRVKITLNTITYKGFSQIDAVGITSEQNIIKIKKELLDSYGLKFRQDKTFASSRQIMRILNSYSDEVRPLVSPAGDEIYFCRVRHNYNTRKRKDLQDVYVSKKVDNVWTYAKNAGAPFNDKYANGVGSISIDGKRLLLTHRKRKKESLFMMERVENQWQKSEKLIIQDFTNEVNSSDYFLTTDTKVLLMAIQSTNTIGAIDLYASFKIDDQTYSKPINMGNALNSTGNDFAPFLALDNKTLYFSSDGHSGFGKSDIFYSKRLDDTWQNWSTPVNLGTEVNSSEWESHYSTSAKGDYAYFISKVGNLNGSLDIFKILLSDEFKPEPSVLITGQVFDAETNFPLSVAIESEILPDGIQNQLIQSNARGDYKLFIQSGHNYGFHAVADGYIAISENIDLTNIDLFQEFKKDLYLVPIESGQVVRLNNIFFNRSKADLLPESQPELERLAEVLKLNTTMVIELGGHTDGVGSPKQNMKLSLDRVVSVRKALIDLGINGRRIIAKAYGGTKPIAPNNTEENRKKNRRVEVKILEK